jgi:hypothetical protein
VLLRVRVPRSIPRRAPVHVHLRTGAHRMSSSPRHDRLDARIVTVSRLQASRDVAARGLAPSVEALDTPLGPRESPRASGVCYSALRRLPRRDLHPLEKSDKMLALARPHRHDATWDQCKVDAAISVRHLFEKGRLHSAVFNAQLPPRSVGNATWKVGRPRCA